MPTRTFSFLFNGGDSISKSFSVSADGEASIDRVISAGATNLGLNLSLIIAKLKSFFLVSDQPLTVKTNSSGAPVNTFTLAANVPIVWSTFGTAFIDSTGAAVITNITELFLTNSGDVDANFSLRAQFDPAA